MLNINIFHICRRQWGIGMECAQRGLHRGVGRPCNSYALGRAWRCKSARLLADSLCRPLRPVLASAHCHMCGLPTTYAPEKAVAGYPTCTLWPPASLSHNKLLSYTASKPALFGHGVTLSQNMRYPSPRSLEGPVYKAYMFRLMPHQSV